MSFVLHRKWVALVIVWSAYAPFLMCGNLDNHLDRMPSFPSFSSSVSTFYSDDEFETYSDNDADIYAGEEKTSSPFFNQPVFHMHYICINREIIDSFGGEKISNQLIKDFQKEEFYKPQYASLNIMGYDLNDPDVVTVNLGCTAYNEYDCDEKSLKVKVRDILLDYRAYQIHKNIWEKIEASYAQRKKEFLPELKETKKNTLQRVHHHPSLLCKLITSRSQCCDEQNYEKPMKKKALFRKHEDRSRHVNHNTKRRQ